jgi:predicted O-methyltransferase YrrM
MTFEQIYEQVNNVVGWMGIEDSKVLHKYASQVEGTIVEIGCFLGRSTKILCLSSPKSTIHTVEVFGRHDASDGNLYTPEDTKTGFLENLKDQTNWKLYHNSSANVAKTWKKKIDLIFIDGDHWYNSVITDINSWLPFMKKGGVMLFHDYEANTFEVKKAVNDRFSNVVQESGIGVVRL